jgi:hypothetical protein
MARAGGGIRVHRLTQSENHAIQIEKRASFYCSRDKTGLGFGEAPIFPDTTKPMQSIKAGSWMSLDNSP